EHREYPEGEGDVGRGGDRPTRRRVSVPRNEQEHDDGHDHAAGGGNRGANGLAQAVELTACHLELELDRDAEEEDRQQEVGDPVRERQLKTGHPDLSVTPMDHRLAKRHVREDEAQRRGAEEEERGESFGAKKLHGSVSGCVVTRISGPASPTRLPGTPVTTLPWAAGRARRGAGAPTRRCRRPRSSASARPWRRRSRGSSRPGRDA